MVARIIITTWVCLTRMPFARHPNQKKWPYFIQILNWISSLVKSGTLWPNITADFVKINNLWNIIKKYCLKITHLANVFCAFLFNRRVCIALNKSLAPLRHSPIFSIFYWSMFIFLWLMFGFHSFYHFVGPCPGFSTSPQNAPSLHHPLLCPRVMGQRVRFYKHKFGDQLVTMTLIYDNISPM